MAVCPDPAHAGSSVVSHGRRVTKTGVRQRFMCTPLVGDPHRFSVVVASNGTPVPLWSPPPPCPDHPTGRVVRDGRYAYSTRKPRQRYRCYPDPTSGQWHRFTPLLPREHVHAGTDSCGECEELRGLHRGDAAVSRRQAWPARLVADTLRDLSRGMTYAEASMRVRTLTNRKVLRLKPGETPEEKKARAESNYTDPRLAQHSWHIAADWVETFAPVLWDHLDANLRDRTTVALDRRAQLCEDGAPDDQPMVVLLDDVPINAPTTDDDGANISRRDYFVLVAAEVRWEPGPKAKLDRRIRLRLVRAYPSNDHHAWKLLLDELGYAPDVIVADAGKGIIKAVDETLPEALFIPSLFHVRRAVTNGLYDTPGAWTRENRRAPKELHPELVEHLSRLTRKHLLPMAPADWSGWWDDLEGLLQTMGVPIEKTRRRRKN